MTSTKKKAKFSLDRMGMIRLLLGKRKLSFVEKQADQPILSESNRISSFLFINGSLKSEIEKRAVAYRSFFHHF